MAFPKAIQQLLLTPRYLPNDLGGFPGGAMASPNAGIHHTLLVGPISSTTAEKKIEKIINNNKSNTYILTYLLTYIT